MAAGKFAHDHDVAGQEGNCGGQVVDFGFQVGFGYGFGYIAGFFSLFTADGTAGKQDFFYFLGVAHDQLERQGGKAAEGEPLTHLGDFGGVRADYDVSCFSDVQAGFDGPAVYLHHDYLVAVQDCLGEPVKLVLVCLESDSLAGFEALGAAVYAVNHGKVEPGAVVLAGAFKDYNVAVIIMVDFPHGLFDIAGHVFFTDADAVVFVRAVQG